MRWIDAGDYCHTTKGVVRLRQQAFATGAYLLAQVTAARQSLVRAICTTPINSLSTTSSCEHQAYIYLSP